MIAAGETITELIDRMPGRLPFGEVRVCNRTLHMSCPTGCRRYRL
jgi:hypothetical protein